MVIECTNSCLKNYTQIFEFGFEIRIVASQGPIHK